MTVTLTLTTTVMKTRIHINDTSREEKRIREIKPALCHIYIRFHVICLKHKRDVNDNERETKRNTALLLLTWPRLTHYTITVPYGFDSRASTLAFIQKLTVPKSQASAQQKFNKLSKRIFSVWRYIRIKVCNKC